MGTFAVVDRAGSDQFRDFPAGVEFRPCFRGTSTAALLCADEQHACAAFGVREACGQDLPLHSRQFRVILDLQLGFLKPGFLVGTDRD